MRRRPHVAEHTAARECRFTARGPAVALALTARLETPGEPCVAISTELLFAYDDAIPEELQYALNDRLFAGIYAALDGARPLPPEGLRVVIPALHIDPSLARLLRADPFAGARIAGGHLEELAREAVAAAWRQLDAASAADPPPQQPER
jgi:hypothetical protein